MIEPLDGEHIRWGRALTTVGWLFVAAYLTVLAPQIRRAFALRQASFDDGLWGQRIELISFATRPESLIILVPASAAATIGAYLVRDADERSNLWLSQLARVVAGLSSVVIALAVLGIVAVFWREADGISDFRDVLGRLGGIAMAAAMIRLSGQAERR